MSPTNHSRHKVTRCEHVLLLNPITPPPALQVYDELSSYFPEHMAQPRDSIVDMVKL